MATAPVPNSASMNSGAGAALLMAFMAEMPGAAGSRPRAFITKVEKAKNTPPDTPAPMAAMVVRT
jgi:hypothetical protein